MITSPYDTLACVGYRSMVTRLEGEVKKALLFGEGFEHLINGVNGEISATLMLPTVGGTIKPFGHPILVELSNDSKYLVADARTMYSVDATRTVRPKVAMANSLLWLTTRLQLQQLWETQNYRLVQTTLDYPTMLYGKVYSEALARKFGLDPVSIARCDMLFAYAFWCFSHTEDQFNSADKRQLAYSLATIIKSGTNDINDVITNLKYFHNLNDLVEALHEEEVVGTKRLSNVTVVTMFEIARTTWYSDAGAPSSEIAAVALEHAPTWLACVFVSLANQSFKNNLSLIAQRYKRTADPSQFVSSIAHLVGGR